MNSELKEFIEYAESEMSKFLKERWLHLTVKERVAIENLLIAYDQMAERLRTPIPSGGIKTAEYVLSKCTTEAMIGRRDNQNIPYYNHDEVLEAIHAYHNQFAGDGFVSKEKVDELLELQKEDIKAWLHRRARDFGGISYHQIDEFIDDYQIVQCHKNENDDKAI
jgi:hypothetical protein